MPLNLTAFDQYLTIQNPSNETVTLWLWNTPYQLPKDKIIEKSTQTSIGLISWVWIIHAGAHILSICLQLFKRKYKKISKNFPRVSRRFIQIQKEEDPKTTLNQPKIAILKPVCGNSENTFENLQSFFKLNYQNYEIAFCVGDKDDPVIEIIKELQTKYHYIDSKIYTGQLDSDSGSGQLYDKVINPKIKNLCQAWYEGGNNSNLIKTSDYIWISDQRIICQDPNILKNMVNQASQNKADLLSAFPLLNRSTPARSKPSTLNISSLKAFSERIENIYFGGELARHMQFFNLFGQNLTVGMCMLMKVETFLKVYPNGISELGDYLSEDFWIGEFFKQHGFKRMLSQVGAIQNHAIKSPIEFNKRLYRWNQLTSTMLPTAIPGILSVNSFINVGMVIAICMSIFGWDSKHSLLFFSAYQTCRQVN